MNEAEFLKIMNEDLNLDSGDNEDLNLDSGDNSVLNTLFIIKKYIPKADVNGAEHDIIFFCDIEDLIKAGITSDDVKKLKACGAIVEGEQYLAMFV